MHKIWRISGGVMMAAFIIWVGILSFEAYERSEIRDKQKVEDKIEIAEYFKKNRADVFQDIKNLYSNGGAKEAYYLANEYLFLDDVELTTVRNNLREEMLLQRLKELPFDNKPLKSLIDERVDIYDELGKLNPDNTSYQDLYKTSSEEKRLEDRGAGVSIL